MKSFSLAFVITACCVSLVSCSSSPRQSSKLKTGQSRLNPVTPGIEQLYRLDLIPRFHTSTQIGSFSSYDRSGGNNDGFGGEYSYIRKEDDGLVLAELKGPGVITRIWTPTPTDDWMEFYFDEETAPRIRVRFRQLFLGDHPAFPRPLVGYGAGGFYCYVPLTFQKSCKVFVRAERIQFYQINYALYPEQTSIETFRPEPSETYRLHRQKAMDLFASAGSDISSYVAPATAEVKTIKKKIVLSPGRTETVFQTNTPGRIVGIRFTPALAFGGKSRAVVLRATWDQDTQPAILAPAGDFFGYAWGAPSMKSLLIGASQNINYCYWPMPFDQSAQIELENQASDGPLVTVEAEILFCPVARRKDEGKFYALWRRENPTTKGQPFTFIRTTGRGHLVGFVQQSQGFESGNTYFFEGDDQTTIDGNLVIHGTGSEDFYNGGWYDVPGRWETRRSFPLSGCLVYQKHLARTGGYRMLLIDAYSYRHTMLQTIEHAPTGNELLNDYCGLTLFYSEHRPTCEIVLPPLQERGVADLERIVFATWWNVPIYAFSFRDTTLTKSSHRFGNQDVRFLSMRSTGDDWFGNHFIGFTCELPAAGQYKIALDVVKGPDVGIVQLFHDEAAVGPALDFYAPEPEQAKNQYLGTLDLPEGKSNLFFKIVDKNENASGLGLDLVNIICERVSEIQK
ncbi:MAG: DUF2961 domain-containing protein [Sedimentisphaerales bacterium]|nr:DUF2961 domain-containing protein [Sedimentisphaerales bacterium]